MPESKPRMSMLDPAAGVGGGIIAIHPGKFSIAVWSPRLNPKGNSYRSQKILGLLTTRTRSSIF
jgi:glutaminase